MANLLDRVVSGRAEQSINDKRSESHGFRPATSQNRHWTMYRCGQDIASGHGFRSNHIGCPHGGGGGGGNSACRKRCRVQAAAAHTDRHSLIDQFQQRAGEPADDRDGLGRAFLAGLTADYARHANRTLRKLRRYRPHDYFKLIATFLPKKFRADVLNLDDMSDEELDKALTAVRAVIAEQEKAAGNSGG